MLRDVFFGAGALFLVAVFNCSSQGSILKSTTFFTLCALLENTKFDHPIWAITCPSSRPVGRKRWQEMRRGGKEEEEEVEDNGFLLSRRLLQSLFPLPLFPRLAPLLSCGEELCGFFSRIYI